MTKYWLNEGDLVHMLDEPEPKTTFVVVDFRGDRPVIRVAGTDREAFYAWEHMLAPASKPL